MEIKNEFFRSLRPEAAPISSMEKLSVLPVWKNNRVEIYSAEKREVGITRVDLIYSCGSLYQTKNAQAQTCMQLLLSGNDSTSAEQIQTHLDSLGAIVQTECTMLDSIISIKSLTEKTIETIHYVFEQILAVSFLESELQNYQQIQIADLARKQQTPGYWSRRNCMENIYEKESPICNFTETKDILNLNSSDLIAFKDMLLGSSNIKIVVSGDYSNSVINLLSSFYEDRKTHSLSIKRENKTVVASFPSIQKTLENSNQINICCALHLGSFSEKEIHHLSLLNLIFGGFFGSRLMQEIREKRGLTYGIHSYLNFNGSGYDLMISSDTNSSKVEETIGAIQELMESLKTNPPAAEELEKAKRYYCGQLRASFDGPFQLSSKIRSLSNKNYSVDYYNLAIPAILSAKTESIQKLAEKHFDQNRLFWSFAGNISKHISV